MCRGDSEEQWVYVGAIALALAAVVVALRWRRREAGPEVVGLAAGAVVALLASVSQTLDNVLNRLPEVGHSWWPRSLIPVAFCVAMLGGVGLDTVLRKGERQRSIRWALGAFGAIALVLALVWAFGRGNLPGHAARVRNDSLVLASRVDRSRPRRIRRDCWWSSGASPARDGLWDRFDG